MCGLRWLWMPLYHMSSSTGATQMCHWYTLHRPLLFIPFLQKQLWTQSNVMKIKDYHGQISLFRSPHLGVGCDPQIRGKILMVTNRITKTKSLYTMVPFIYKAQTIV